MQPTIAIFDSFFRGFSRHGKPSSAVDFVAEHPEVTTWEVIPEAMTEGDDAEAVTQHQPGNNHVSAHQLQLWRIETFQEIFDAFLRFEPDCTSAIPSVRDGRVIDRSRETATRKILTPYGWLTLSEKRKLDALRSAPSSNQLFWILTAIRRVSNDHAGWSLAMWNKVVTKFTLGNSESTSSAHSRSEGKVAWIGFRLDNRLRRVVEHLESRLSQEHEQEDEEQDLQGHTLTEMQSASLRIDRDLGMLFGSCHRHLTVKNRNQKIFTICYESAEASKAV